MSVKKEVDYLLNYCGGVLIGSRAFGVHNKESDFDICILKSDLPNSYDNDLIRPGSIYLNMLPMGNVDLIRRPKIDILIYEDRKDLYVVGKVVSTLKKLPKKYLADKNLRIHLFEFELESNGFIPNKNKTKKDNLFDIPF